MKYEEVERIAHVHKRILDLKAKIPAINIYVGDEIRLVDDCFAVAYALDEVSIRAYSYGRKTELLPSGIQFHREGTKDYLVFLNGAGREVNYLLPSEGLRVKRLGRDLYHALNPLQDYIIEYDTDAKKAEQALCDNLKEYVRSMYPVLECPDAFRTSSAWGEINYRDKTNWYNFLVQYKFYKQTGYGDYERRVKTRYWSKTEYGKLNETPKGLITKINEYFDSNHLGYSVKKKSPFTPPHCNPLWGKLTKLKEAGLVPE